MRVARVIAHKQRRCANPEDAIFKLTHICWYCRKTGQQNLEDQPPIVEGETVRVEEAWGEDTLTVEYGVCQVHATRTKKNGSA